MRRHLAFYKVAKQRDNVPLSDEIRVSEEPFPGVRLIIAGKRNDIVFFLQSLSSSNRCQLPCLFLIDHRQLADGFSFNWPMIMQPFIKLLNINENSLTVATIRFCMKLRAKAHAISLLRQKLVLAVLALINTDRFILLTTVWSDSKHVL